MKNKLMLVILLGMFLFSFASVSAFDSHKQNTDYDLTISHNTATSCQATWIKFPNGTQNILNSDMTQDGTTFYTTISSGNFSSLGTTCLGISCTDGSTNEVGSKCVDVGYTGFSNEKTIFFSFISLFIILGIVFIFFGINHDTKMMIFSAISFIAAGLAVLKFPFGAEQEFIKQALSIILNGIGLVILGVHVIKDWFDA